MSEAFSAPTKEELRANMDRGLAQFLAFLDQFSQEEMLSPTDDAGWTVRDHVAHCAVWAEGIAALLRRENRWAAMGIEVAGYEELEHDLDKFNEQIARNHRDVAPAEARAWLIEAHGRVAAAVETLSEAELSAPYDHFVPPFTGREGAPIFAYIIGNTAHHYAEHTPWIEAIVHGDSV